jgi:hypothetical protein
MIDVASYVEVKPGCPISYDVQAADGAVEILFGSPRGYSSALHLSLSDPEMFTQLADLLVKARDEFVSVLRDREKQAKNRLRESAVSPAA